METIDMTPTAEGYANIARTFARSILSDVKVARRDDTARQLDSLLRDCRLSRNRSAVPSGGNSGGGRTMTSLDRQSAMTARDFHHGDDCAHGVTVGPRGGVTYPHTELWRRNGATQTWRRDPERFRIPVKYGLRGYGALTESAAGVWHTGRAEECADGRLADDIATLAEPCEICRQTGGRCRFETGCSCWRGIPCNA